ncbi:MAG: protoheme IX farnesyltransferase [Methylococcaceae bacterium]|nr:protoheme IX farnesyltransferase [Methylococcaceae bacterium]
MINASSVSVHPPVWKSYVELCKPNVVAEMIFTAWVGMLLAVPDFPTLDKVLYGLFGIGLAAASAAAVNQYVERDMDIYLNAHRPIPSGRISPQQAIIFAVILGVLSMLILIFKVNGLTATLSFVALLGYAFIYTSFLKKMTSQNIVIGGIFGSAPPLLGWTAITNEVHPYGLLLVLIIFVWTPPHFWPLAIARYDKLKKAYEEHGIRMLPVTHGLAYTRLQILLWSILLLLVTLLPYLTGMSGLVYLTTAVLFGLGFMGFAILMMRTKSNKTAMQTFWYSIVYITVLFAGLLGDHYYRFTL